MADANKTAPTDIDPLTYVAAVEHPVRRRDAQTLLDLMARATGQTPRMWGPSSIGYGQYHYKYASGREGDSAAAGFSPRKAATTVYLADGVGAAGDLLERLGPHTASVGCLYFKDLSVNDLGVLERIVRESYERLTSGTFGDRAGDSSGS